MHFALVTHNTCAYLNYYYFCCVIYNISSPNNYCETINHVICIICDGHVAYNVISSGCSYSPLCCTVDKHHWLSAPVQPERLAVRRTTKIDSFGLHSVNLYTEHHRAKVNIHRLYNRTDVNDIVPYDMYSP